MSKSTLSFQERAVQVAAMNKLGGTLYHTILED